MNNPLLFIDEDGLFPIVIHVRSFAPFEYFGARNWHGDNRGFSTNSDDLTTSRLRVRYDYETQSQAYTATATGSISRARYGISLIGGARIPLLPTTSIGFVPNLTRPSNANLRGGFGTNSINSYSFSGTGSAFGSHLYGNDDAIVEECSESFFAPDIDVITAFSVNVTPRPDGSQVLTIVGVMVGDQFPSAEAFVDIGGTKVFLGVAPAKYCESSGPFIALNNPGWAPKPMAILRGTFLVSKEGRLLGALRQNGQMVSPAEWNAPYERTNTVDESAECDE
jgi:hypothetical protein